MTFFHTRKGQTIWHPRMAPSPLSSSNVPESSEQPAGHQARATTTAVERLQTPAYQSTSLLPTSWFPPQPAFPKLPSQRADDCPLDLFPPEESSDAAGLLQVPPYMSSYSPSLQGDRVHSVPDAQQYHLIPPGTMSNPKAMSQISPGFVFVNFLSPSDCYCRTVFP